MNCRKHVTKVRDLPKVCPAAKRIRRQWAVDLYVNKEMSANQAAIITGYCSGQPIIRTAGFSYGPAHGQRCRWKEKA